MATVESSSPLTRIACFYDGSFAERVSMFYAFYHTRKKFFSYKGFQDFIRQKVADEEENGNLSRCQIVESHFFRGRFSLRAARSVGAIEKDRELDQLLMLAGITTHYYPMNENTTPPQEKGIDVWLALEAYDLAVHKRFDVLVLFAGDQDFVPLIRKVHSIGTRVMLVAVDVKYTDSRDQKPKNISTSPPLLNEAAYRIILNEEIDSKKAKVEGLIDGLFDSY